MKKNSFTLPFKSNFFKEQDPFHLVIIFFIIFFGTAIFFSIPSFYNYEKYNQKIENVINNEFKIKLHNLEDISFKFIPSPHLLIKKAKLKIQDNEKKPVSELNNIKVFISIAELYKNDKFKISKVEVNKANLYLNNTSLKNFINNLKTNIVNNFIIKKSTLFYKDKNDEITLISKVKDFDYIIDFVNKKKILKINGNIFDSNYEFRYLIDYKYSNIQNVYLELTNPNLIIENKLIEDSNTSNFNQQGNLNIQFLNLKNVINYEIIKNNINFKNKELKNSNFDLNGSINFLPFHFDLIVDIKKISLLDLENLFYMIYKNKNLKFDNLSGDLKINLNNFGHKVMKNGVIKLKFENDKLSSDKKILYLNEFASLEITDFEYLQDNDQILQMNIKVNVFNQEKFNRFLFNYKKNKTFYENFYFTYQFNANTKNSFISRVSNSGFKNSSEFYKFKNLQQLKNLLKDEKVFILD